MSDALNNFDIAICGAGPVGLAVAALLVKHGVAANRIAVLDAQSPQPTSDDPRSIALSYGSSQILQEIVAWPFATQPITHIHVSRRGYLGRTLIDCNDYGLPALGYVARYSALVNTLSQACQAADIQRRHSTLVTSIIENDHQVQLLLSTGEMLTANIVIQAEGGVFGEQVGKTQQRDYEQTAIVAQVSVSAPTMTRAFERFTNEGPLALLPQAPSPGDLSTSLNNCYGLVWCMQAATAQALLKASDAAFLTALQQAFGDRVGRFTKVSAHSSYKLGLSTDTTATKRTITIGNAAQTLHPVAGQGLNLGLRDAKVLSKAMAHDCSPVQLQHFLKERIGDRNTTIRLTDVMARIFADTPGGVVSQTLLGLSLGMVDVLTPVKKVLAQQMMFGRR